jgi:hypothetical protein
MSDSKKPLITFENIFDEKLLIDKNDPLNSSVLEVVEVYNHIKWFHDISDILYDMYRKDREKFKANLKKIILLINDGHYILNSYFEIKEKYTFDEKLETSIRKYAFFGDKNLVCLEKFVTRIQNNKEDEDSDYDSEGDDDVKFDDNILNMYDDHEDCKCGCNPHDNQSESSEEEYDNFDSKSSESSEEEYEDKFSDTESLEEPIPIINNNVSNNLDDELPEL